MGPPLGLWERAEVTHDASQVLVVQWIPPISPGTGQIARPEELSLPQTE